MFNVHDFGPGFGFVLMFLFLGALICYFLPTIIAYQKGHRNASAILGLNLLIGWTGLGWVVLLVWAFLKD